VNPALTPAAATGLLTQNTDDLGTPGFDTMFGWGRVNAYKVVAAAKAQLTPPSISISPQITSLPVGTWKQFTATVMNSTAPVVWTVNPPLGDIFSTGAFHAPIALWTSGTVTVTATAGNVSASAQVTVLAGSASPAAFSPVYVNAGGPAYTDPQG